jgi:hypothetical protein
MSTAARIVAVVAAVVAINVLLHVVALPHVDLPSVDPPGWLHVVVRAKNFLLIGVLLLVIVGGILEDNRRRGGD